MPCAADELCLWHDSTPKEPHGHTRRGGCGGRLHGNCGDVDQEGDTEMQRICLPCVAAKQSSQATTGKRKLGNAASGKGGPGAKEAASKSRGRLTPAQKLEVVELLRQKTQRSVIVEKYSCSERTVSNIASSKDELKEYLNKMCDEEVEKNVSDDEK